MDEDLDVEWLYYYFTKILDNTEEEFWKSTPRKIFKLIEIHCNINDPEKDINKSKNGSYISNGEKVLKCLD